jgi:hypothetical protein
MSTKIGLIHRVKRLFAPPLGGNPPGAQKVRRRRLFCHTSSRHTRLMQPTLIGMEEKGARRTSVPRGPFIGLFFRLRGFARTWQLFMIIRHYAWRAMLVWVVLGLAGSTT